MEAIKHVFILLLCSFLMLSATAEEKEYPAYYRVATVDASDGESAFLPTIGAGHVAAMPYEIILQGKEATMLHGRYRIALHWPELGMGTFMKIMSTPGNIEDFMLGVTELNED